MPESWSEWSPDYGEDIKDGFDCKYVKESRYISFATSTKSMATLLLFIKEVCPHILEEDYHIELYHEYWDCSTLYQIDKGHAVGSGSIRYKEPHTNDLWGY